MATFLENIWKVVEVIFKVIYLYLEQLVLLFVPKTPKSLKDEVILITGSGNGLGKQICKRLASTGATLVLWDILQKENEETATELKSLGVKNLLTDTVDVSNRLQVSQAAARIRNRFGPVTILVNNAAVAYIQPFLQESPAAIQKTFDVNILAHFWTIQEFLPEMIAMNKGQVVSVCAFFGLADFRGAPAYSASKHAVHGLIESLRDELDHLPQKCNVKLTTAYPFFMGTRMVGEDTTGMRLKFRFQNLIPIMKPEWAAGKIVDGILYEKSYVYIPAYQRIFLAIKFFFPWRVERELVDLMLENFEYPPVKSEDDHEKDNQINQNQAQVPKAPASPKPKVSVGLRGRTEVPLKINS